MIASMVLMALIFVIPIFVIAFLYSFQYSFGCSDAVVSTLNPAIDRPIICPGFSDIVLILLLFAAIPDAIFMYTLWVVGRLLKRNGRPEF